MLFDFFKTFSLDQWETSWIAWFFLCVGIALIGFPTLRRIQRLREKVRFLKDRHYFYKVLLDAASEARCWWGEKDTHLECTAGLIELLGLNSDQPVAIQDVINQFVPDDAYRLDQSIQNLRQTRDPFDLSLTLIDGHTILRIMGYCFGENMETNYVLALSDVTQEDRMLDRLHTQLQKVYEEKNWYEQIINIIPVAVWRRDGKLGLQYCNQVYAGIVDGQPDKVLEEGRELVDKQRTSSPYQLAQKALATGLSQSKRSHLIVDGHRRMIEVTEVPIPEANATLGYALDITDLEEATIDLTNHIASHQEVLHHLSTPIAVYGSDMRLEFFNNAYLKLFDFEEKWLYQKPLYSEILNDLRERRKMPEHSDFSAFRNQQLGLFNSLIEPIQELMHQPDGQILRMMIVPHPMGGLLFLFDDVTDKLALERRYNTLIAVQKETLDHLYEGVVVLGSDNRLRLSNPAAAKLWQVDDIEMAPGRHAGEILYQIRHMFKGYTEWDEFRQRTLSMFNSRQPVSDRMVLVDETVLQYSYVPLPDGSHLLGFIDLSDRWRFEQALRERNDALEQADRFKSDFISHVSYELRAPLNTIIGFTEILLNQYFGNLNERQIDYCRGVNDSSQRLLSLINDIIDFASVEAGQLSLKIHPVDLESYLTSLIGLVYNRCNDQGLEISYTNKTNVKTFLADERRLKQALFNLLMNAIKFTPAGGRISLVADLEEAEDGKNLCLSVVDTGVGMNEEEQKQVFKIFESGSRAHKSKLGGTGIGLPLVKSFIGLHGGTVSLKSEPGKGTVVVCKIPLLMESGNRELNLVPRDAMSPLPEEATSVALGG